MGFELNSGKFYIPPLIICMTMWDRGRFGELVGQGFRKSQIMDHPNPPNSPQICPIEDFSGLLKAAVYEKGWEATSFNSLKRRIRKKMAEMGSAVCQRRMAGLKTKIRFCADNGVISAVH